MDKFERSLSTTTKVVVGIQWATTTKVVVGIQWATTTMVVVGIEWVKRRIHLTWSCASSPDNPLSDKPFLMLSNHLRFGLPILLFPSTSIAITLLPTYSSSHLNIYHFNLLPCTFLYFFCLRCCANIYENANSQLCYQAIRFEEKDFTKKTESENCSRTTDSVSTNLDDIRPCDEQVGCILKHRRNVPN